MIPYLYSRTFQTEVLIRLVLTKNGTNVDSAMYSSGNGKVGKALQKGFGMAYNMCPRSKSYIRRGDIAQSHWHRECRFHIMKGGLKVREEFIPTVE